jgi:molybdenum cofactor cytidylyltransferase
MKTGAVILAAGKASRFGSPKQLLEVDGETLLDRACRTALAVGCDPVVRILGAHADLILERRCPEGVETLIHADWEKGMGTSLAAGVSHLLALCPDLEAVFVLLTDQPSVTVELLETLKSGLQQASVVWCGYENVTGPPALFDRQHFQELLALDGDRGAKAVAARHQAAVIPFPEAVWDIDSPETWERFLVRV